jgi:hypothetical protein
MFSGVCARLPVGKISEISAALKMRRIFSVIALEGDLITATASHNDVSDATFAIVDEIDLGFLPAVGGSRGVERETLIYTIGKGIA